MKHLARHLVRAGTVPRTRDNGAKSDSQAESKVGRQPNNTREPLDSWKGQETSGKVSKEARESSTETPVQNEQETPVNKRRKRERKKERTVRKIVVGANVSEAEYAAITKYADTQRTTVAELIRQILFPVVGLDANLPLASTMRRRLKSLY
jgi:hypothetical protein